MRRTARSIGWTLLLAPIGVAAIGCAASREYRCPDPIGPIVRDECEVYQTRYESAKLSLQAGIGPASVGATVSEEALRNPSELIQVMSQRLVALCHDFNACRLTSADYLARREEMDRTMTAITTLGGELRRPDLKPAERERLLEQLLGLLGAPAPRRQPSQPDVKPPPKETPAPRKVAFFSDTAWFDSLKVPPVAPPVEEGFPRLIKPWGRGTIEIVWVPRSPDKPYDKKIGGYQVRPHLTLWGKLEADDQIEIRFPDGKRVRCPVRINREGIGDVGCKLPDDYPATGDRFEYTVAFHRAMTDTWAEIGRMGWKITRPVEGAGYEIDHDADLEEGWLFFAPEPRALPPDFEQPVLQTTLRLRKYQKATARCFVGDEPVTRALGTARGTGQTGTLQDRPRYRKTDPHTSVAVAEPFVQWWHYQFALPFVVPRAKESPPEGMALWPPKTGAWRCRVSVDGTPVRELRFTVLPDGRLDPVEGQRGRPGDLVHPWWKVEARIIPNSVEAVREDR